MIQSFLDSWPLFADTYLAGWFIAALLAGLGVIVVARDQIFIGAAIAQSSTLGIAVAITLGGALGLGAGSEEARRLLVAIAAVAFAVLASLLTARRGRRGRESHEAITGWVFLAGASLSVLIVAHSPHGLDEVHRLLASSIIGARPADVWVFGGLLAATGLGLLIGHRPLLLIVMDPETAEAGGVRVGLWMAAFALWLGLGVGLSLRTAGMLYAFGCLVLPALIAKGLCRRVRSMLIVAPAVGLLAAVVSSVLANHHDLPPAQATVALLAIALLPAWGVRRLRSPG